jgi:LPS export ABC transporter protein LptC
MLALLVMAAIIGIVTVVLRNGPHGSTPVSSTGQQLPHNIDITLKKARFSEIQDGQVAWELVAERVDYDKSGDTAFLTDIRMEFQQSGSQGAVTVTADKGEYLSVAKNIRLAGHVQVVTEDGASFKTGTMVYSGAAKLFSTADPVVFRQQRLQLAAVGMDLNVKSQRARFFSSVDATIIQN